MIVVKRYEGACGPMNTCVLGTFHIIFAVIAFRTISSTSQEPLRHANPVLFTVSDKS